MACSENQSEMTFKSVKSLFDLTGKKVVITGGAGWLGTYLTESVLELGAEAFIVSRNPDRQNQAVERILADIPGAKLKAMAVDVSSRDSVDSCFSRIGEEYGGVIDVLINSAYAGKSAAIEDVSDDDWSAALDVGVSGYLRCLRAALPCLKKSKSGNIINVSSMYGLVAPYPSLYDGNDFLNPPAYGAAKAAVIQLTRYCAVHLAKFGIRANSISPDHNFAVTGTELKSNT